MFRLKKTCNNFHRVEIETKKKDIIILHFSYETLIGFRFNDKLFVSQNYWSNSTGKHIGMLESDKGKRYDEANFKLAQQNYLKGIV